MKTLVLLAAMTAHEANRAFCSSQGTPQPHWEDMTEDYKARTLAAVKAIKANPELTPEAHHKLWLKAMKQAGWTKGKVRCHDLRQSPCMVSYAFLAPADQAKSILFINVVRAVLAAQV